MIQGFLEFFFGDIRNFIFLLVIGVITWAISGTVKVSSMSILVQSNEISDDGILMVSNIGRASNLRKEAHWLDWAAFLKDLLNTGLKKPVPEPTNSSSERVWFDLVQYACPIPGEPLMYVVPTYESFYGELERDDRCSIVWRNVVSAASLVGVGKRVSRPFKRQIRIMLLRKDQLDKFLDWDFLSTVKVENAQHTQRLVTLHLVAREIEKKGSFSSGCCRRLKAPINLRPICDGQEVNWKDLENANLLAESGIAT